MSAAALVYGYVRSSVDRPEYVKQCIEEIEQRCARAGLTLGGTSTDIGAPLDTEDRIGFCGLLQALAMPTAAGVVVLDSSRLSPRADVVTTLVGKVSRTGAWLKVKDGELPESARKLQQGRTS